MVGLVDMQMQMYAIVQCILLRTSNVIWCKTEDMLEGGCQCGLHHQTHIGKPGTTLPEFFLNFQGERV